MTERHYAERDAMAIDARGGYYSRHVKAMTAEKLHSKSDIAAELAYRDMLIDHLREELSNTLERYDQAHEWADKLSAEISDFFGLSIGEHSSANSPWFEAWNNMPEKAVYDAELLGAVTTQRDALMQEVRVKDMEAVTQRGIVLDLCNLIGIRVHDYHCISKAGEALAARDAEVSAQALQWLLDHQIYVGTVSGNKRSFVFAATIGERIRELRTKAGG